MAEEKPDKPSSPTVPLEKHDIIPSVPDVHEVPAHSPDKIIESEVGEGGKPDTPKPGRG